MTYQRPQSAVLARRLAEPRRFIQVVAGPRQVGKTTLVQQVVEAAGLIERAVTGRSVHACLLRANGMCTAS